MNEKTPNLKLPRSRLFKGSVRVPGSKSIANRALLLSSLCSGETILENVPDSDDVQVLLRALPELGVSVQRLSHNSCLVKSAGGPYAVRSGRINLENAGTALRPLTAILAAGQGSFLIDGDAQMRRRPIQDLVDALKNLGVDIDSSDGFPPVRLEARGLPGGVTQIAGSVSSQFLSALLLAGPLAESELQILLPEEPVSKPYIDLTLRMMDEFGVSVKRSGYLSFTVPHAVPYVTPGRYSIEGDASAATYFLAMGSLPGCGPVTVEGISTRSMQGDVHFAGILSRMGAQITSDKNSITASGPPHGSVLSAVDVDMNDMPDAAMTLAALALFARGETKIRNIANLRVKESERIRGLRIELEKLGAAVVEKPDALYITPPESVRSASIETYRDHRMAMAFALASYGADIEIQDPGCVSKTYPEFFQDFLRISGT